MKPLVSIIICTCSRVDTINDTLQSILDQDLDGTFDTEVLIIDNSADGIMKTSLDPWYAQYHGRLRYLHEPTRGKSNALNHGVQRASGDILAFTDDDVLADSKWLSTLVGCMNQHNCDGVGGRVLPIFPIETPQWIKDNPVKIAGGVVIYDYGEAVEPHDPKHYPWIGANFAFKRSVFTESGLFRPDLGPGMPAMGEDTEIVERLVELKKVLYYCGKAVIWHPVDLKRITLRHMAKWHIALGRYAARREIEKNEKFPKYLGVPRYIWKGLLVDAFTGTICVFDRLKFFDAWRAFFRKIGMIQEYRQIK